MRITQRAALYGAAVAVAGTVVWWIFAGMAAGLSFLAGVLVAGLSLCSLVLMGWVFAHFASTGLRSAAIFLHLLKYPLLVVLLYVLIVVWHAHAIAVLAGCTLAVIFFVATAYKGHSLPKIENITEEKSTPDD